MIFDDVVIEDEMLDGSDLGEDLCDDTEADTEVFLGMFTPEEVTPYGVAVEIQISQAERGELPEAMGWPQWTDEVRYGCDVSERDPRCNHA